MADGQDEISEVSATNNSIETFTSALVFNLVVGIVIFLVFCVLRPLNHVVYAPRANLAQADKHPPEIGNGFISWVWPTLRIPDAQVLERTTLDSFMLLRFFQSCLKLFGLFTLLGIGILLPINVHGGGSETGLQALAISNVSEGSNLLWAHLVVTVVFLAAVLFTLLRDIQLYIRLRHNYLTNPIHQASAQSHALLVTDIPRHLQSKDHLARLFSVFPGGVRQVYLPRGVPKLEELVMERDSTALA
ncbi:phosphate metabolism protein 7, partial [Dimargaris verticillata]